MNTRYYQFADISLAVKGCPAHLPDGPYLEPFRTGEAVPDVTLYARTETIILPEDARRSGLMRYEERGGRCYLYNWFRTPDPAIRIAPEDWSGAEITATVHPELYEDPVFSVNWLLSLSGFHSGLLHRRCGTLHCSYIRHRGRAILFAGFSGAGKSTQAELWRRERGAEVINGDRALVFPRAAGWCAGGVSVCGSSKICRNETAPLAAIVLLEQGPENVILPMTAAARYRAVLAGLAFHRWSKAETALAGHLAMDLIGAVPVLRLRNRADLGAVEALERAMGGLHEDV